MLRSGRAAPPSMPDKAQRRSRLRRYAYRNAASKAVYSLEKYCVIMNPAISARISPMMPPIADRVADSKRNCFKMSACRAPRLFRIPISFVRSVTATSMIFMMTMLRRSERCCGTNKYHYEDRSSYASYQAGDRVGREDSEIVLFAEIQLSLDPHQSPCLFDRIIDSQCPVLRQLQNMELDSALVRQTRVRMFLSAAGQSCPAAGQKRSLLPSGSRLFCKEFRGSRSRRRSLALRKELVDDVLTDKRHPHRIIIFGFGEKPSLSNVRFFDLSQ